MSSAMQKVIIPKGLINPNETTIVEIPPNLHNVSTVVAKPKDESSSSVAIPQPKILSKKSYLRKTFPGLATRKAGRMTEGATTFAGRPFEDSVDASMYEPQSPSIPSSYEGFDIDYDKTSTPKGLSYVEGASFNRPKIMRYPPGMDHLGRPRPLPTYESAGSPPPTSYRKTEISSALPDGRVSTTEMTEESYEDDSYDPNSFSSYDPGSLGAPFPQYEGSSFDDSDGRHWTGAHVRGELPTPPLPLARRAQTFPNPNQPDLLMNSLGELESQELHKIMGDLNTFQNARRRLIQDASSLASASDVSESMMSGMSM